MGLVFADGHLHCNPVRGLGGYRIAARFKDCGGWFMALVGLPPWHYGLEVRGIDTYERSYDIHLRECREASRAGVRVACIVGMHPAEIDRLVSMGYNVDKLVDFVDKVVKLLERLAREGLVDGLGEVGRQHYTTQPERYALAEYVMLRVLEVARDYDLVVHLHLESGGLATVATVDKLVRLVGYKRLHRIVFHHATTKMTSKAVELGYTATVLGRKELLRAVLGSVEPRFMVESDFLDDPRRPCVAACPWDVVAAQRSLVEEGVVWEDVLWRINVDVPCRVYGVEPP